MNTLNQPISILDPLTVCGSALLWRTTFLIILIHRVRCHYRAKVKVGKYIPNLFLTPTYDFILGSTTSVTGKKKDLSKGVGLI